MSVLTKETTTMADNGKKTIMDTAGARAFANILTQLDEGRVHGEISDEMQRLTTELQHYASNTGKAKGTLTLKLSLSTDDSGVVMIDADVTVKAPKLKAARTAMWVDKAGNLVAENPRQQKLPGLREVPPAPPTREVPAEKTDVKSV